MLIRINNGVYLTFGRSEMKDMFCSPEWMEHMFTLSHRDSFWRGPCCCCRSASRQHPAPTRGCEFALIVAFSLVDRRLTVRALGPDVERLEESTRQFGVKINIVEPTLRFFLVSINFPSFEVCRLELY